MFRPSFGPLEAVAPIRARDPRVVHAAGPRAVAVFHEAVVPTTQVTMCGGSDSGP